MKKSDLPSVAELPVRVGIRLIALARLEEGLAARERLVSSRDGEALHDFRVALRRLRSGLRAYRPWFEDTVGREERHDLRDIARATGRSRDIEVQLHWLSHATLPGPASDGAGLLRRRLQSDLRASDRNALRAAHRFPGMAKRLRECLLRYCDVIDPDAPFSMTTCAAVTAGLARACMEELESDFEAMQTVDDGALAAHRARIEVKRFRYLVEPFRPDVETATPLLATLKELQDGLGEMHDLDVLVTELEQARSDLDGGASKRGSADHVEVLDALMLSVRELRDAKLEAVRGAWLNRCATALAAGTRRFCRELGELGGNAGYEIERKYLLSGLPARRKGRTVVRIDQGWLPGDRVQERIRRVRGEQGTKWLRTIKLGSGLVRREIEEEIDEALFRTLWPLTRGRRISKRRYSFRDGGREWIIDRFLGLDLVLAEVELSSPAERVPIPDWLERYIEKEVTGRADYLNVNLAVRAGGAGAANRA